ncbi:MAG: amidohydrolase [Deltaproteobacteria bacterium]|nr:amidohydrolase [Candidatus Zymogenaceae bacterium]
MIIDIHRHILDRGYFSDNYWRGFARMALPILRRMGVQADVDMIINDILPVYYDTTGEKHLAAMEEAGIDMTVLFAFDTGLMVGEPEIGIEQQNMAVFKIAARYPKKVIPFATMDPRRPNAGDFVKKSVQEWGARGLKLHPGSGFNPESRETLGLVEAVAGYGIPILFHTGPSVPPTSSKYCDPMYLDGILLRFPEVNVIAAHMGYGYRDILFSLGINRPNLYTDIAAWQTTARDRRHDFNDAVGHAVAHFGPERVLFGTDNPYLWPVLPEPQYVQAVRDLAVTAPEQTRITQQDVQMILGDNAAGLLKL